MPLIHDSTFLHTHTNEIALSYFHAVFICYIDSTYVIHEVEKERKQCNEKIIKTEESI